MAVVLSVAGVISAVHLQESVGVARYRPCQKRPVGDPGGTGERWHAQARCRPAGGGPVRSDFALNSAFSVNRCGVRSFQESHP